MPDSTILVTHPAAGTNIAFNIDSKSDCYNFYAGMPSGDSCSVGLTDSQSHPNPVYAEKDLYSSEVTSENRIFDAKMVAFPTPITANSNVIVNGQWTGTLKYNKDYGTPDITIAQRIRRPAINSSYNLYLNLVFLN